MSVIECPKQHKKLSYLAHFLSLVSIFFLFCRDLSSNNIQALRAGVFSGLTKLTLL